MSEDKHVRRSGSDYAQAYANLLPFGIAWPRHVESVLMRVVRGLCEIWGYVDSRAADLLERESDPRLTTEVTYPVPDGLLPDWERNWGLPDPCFPETPDMEMRRAMLLKKITWMGAQSRAYFEELMAWIGFDIYIKEFAPFMAGVSRVGDTRPKDKPKDNFRWYIGPPEIRFFWTAHAGIKRVIWFRAASGQAGVDPHCRLEIDDDLQCLLNRWKPAHTDLVLDVSGHKSTTDPMYGTP